MRYTFISFGIILLLLVSCNKPANQPQRISKLLTKISSSPTDFRSYTYDANKLLTNHTIQFINGNGTSVMSVNYSYVNGMINTAGSQGGSVFYEAEGNQVKVVRSFRPMGSEISVINYSYNSKGQLIEWREKFNQPDIDQPKESKQIFEYYADGNVKRMMYYLKMTNDGPFVLNGSTVYDQYDQFKNPEIPFPGTVYLPSIVFQKNNFGRMRHYAANGELYQTSTFEYTYDADGYPSTKLYRDDRSTIPIVFTYQYQ
ncbi:hypothetical protein [Lacibacter sp.]|uniref:hypothetical protein n=1 Tax=Lacibacter sp. TaxID=1915409 RepID=UPI002B4AEADD|nr:hypothetical protein [Lacibacter sp.]HLP38733.1 hypothetical protein [Lacibacter sp.]